MNDIFFMEAALKEAAKAVEHNDIPVGAVIVQNNEIIVSKHNEVEIQQDTTAHAEILAIKEATKKIGYKFLLDCSIYVTLEPCPMCAGAIVLARIPYLFYAAADSKAGACHSLFSITEDKRLNHRCYLTKGLLEDEASNLIKEFFKNLRNGK